MVVCSHRLHAFVLSRLICSSGITQRKNEFHKPLKIFVLQFAQLPRSKQNLIGFSARIPCASGNPIGIDVIKLCETRKHFR